MLPTCTHTCTVLYTERLLPQSVARGKAFRRRLFRVAPRKFMKSEVQKKGEKGEGSYVAVRMAAMFVYVYGCYKRT